MASSVVTNEACEVSNDLRNGLFVIGTLIVVYVCITPSHSVIFAGQNL